VGISTERLPLARTVGEYLFASATCSSGAGLHRDWWIVDAGGDSRRPPEGGGNERLAAVPVDQGFSSEHEMQLLRLSALLRRAHGASRLSRLRRPLCTMAE